MDSSVSHGRLLNEAAVAIIMTAQPDPEVLILKRAANRHDPWSGHYAFPGGRRDPEDGSLLVTCKRETQEECGIVLNELELVKQYPVRIAGNHHGTPIPVTSFLFELAAQPRLSLEATEISTHQWLSCRYAHDARSVIVRKSMSRRWPEKGFPCIPLDQGYLWGFTYETLKMVLADRFGHP